MIRVGEISERGRVTYAFLFERLAVTVRRWVEHGPDGPEQGARIEIQRLEARTMGSEFSGQPVDLKDPIWRADLFTLVSGPPGNFDRAHFHAIFNGDEPPDRSWDTELTADPIAWLETQLGQRLADVLTTAGASDLAGGPEAADVQAVLPQIFSTPRDGACPRIHRHHAHRDPPVRARETAPRLRLIPASGGTIFADHLPRVDGATRLVIDDGPRTGRWEGALVQRVRRVRRPTYL